MRSINRERLEELVHSQVNKHRQDHELQCVAYDSALLPICRYHSSRMAKYGRVFHQAPDDERLSDRLDKFAYDLQGKKQGVAFCQACGGDMRTFAAPTYCADCGTMLCTSDQRRPKAGENVAMFDYGAQISSGTSVQSMAKSVVDGWLNSTGHRENLLDSAFERQAIGAHIAEQETISIYYTQILS